jgi:FAD/FMN-containing dehydrogenase
MDATVYTQLQSQLPHGRVTQNPDDIDASITINPLLEGDTKPSCIAHPRNTEELKGVIAFSNREKLNLTISSSTGRHTKGGIDAGKEHVRVDLSSWKEILWINRRNRVCMIQPGVTYGALLAALKEHGMTLAMPPAPRSGKSVVAAITDREPTTWPNRHWDYGDPVASTEVVFGDGSLFRTGSAGGPGSLEAQRAIGGAQKYSGGPSQTDLHRVVQGSQGTMGAVTWISVRAEILPTIQEPLLIGSDALGDLVSFTYAAGRSSLGEHTFILNRRAAAMLMHGASRTSFDDIHDSLPGFVSLINIAGFERLPKKRVAYQKKDIKTLAEKNGLTPSSRIGPLSAESLLAVSTTPCGETDWRHALSGHCLCVFFLTTLDRAGEFAGIFSAAATEHGVDPRRIGIYIQPVVQNHACHVEFMIPFDPDDTEDQKRLRALEKSVVTEAARSGAFFSRPYGFSQDIAFGQYELHHALLKKVKGIFDPNRVMNNGKWDL